MVAALCAPASPDAVDTLPVHTAACARIRVLSGEEALQPKRLSTGTTHVSGIRDQVGFVKDFCRVYGSHQHKQTITTKTGRSQETHAIFGLARAWDIAAEIVDLNEA